jgi:uncharacterized protein YyaL (SSP411 family)
MSTPQHPANRLAGETSLYLRQHAHNPVDWFPWGPEALAKAKELDRPIFLSVGYSACHWCHVMAHESFEDAEVGRFLNEYFVSIKLDREERPDLDALYMTAVQMLNNGQGGWPMSVFLTPDLQPFFAGTYFPPRDHYGRPGFPRLLRAILEAWQGRKDEVVRSAGQITAALREHGGLETGRGDLSVEILRHAQERLRAVFDFTHGGFGGAPKFPHALDLRFLLRAWRRFGADDALTMVRLTLDKMAGGGIYDHLGGGFARYSVDERWLVPHFEKMLYDNALLSVAYIEAWQATGDPNYERVVRETLDYVLRDMTSPHGAFYTAEDADSEGEEGKFYVWSREELTRVLGESAADTFAVVYDVTPEGNFEGHNILNRNRTDEQEARLLKMEPAALTSLLAEGRQKLLAERAKRVRPGRDEKILTAWNGLMIDAFARCGAALGEPRYLAAAERAATFVLDRLRGPDGRLLRTCGDDAPAKIAGYLEDYAFLAESLMSLYEATFEPRWLAEAITLAEMLLRHFRDPSGGFFFTADDGEQVLHRSKDVHDGSTPSGNSVAATMLLRLAALTGRSDFREAAAATLTAFTGMMERSPAASGQMLVALDFHLGPTREYAVIGEPTHDDVRQVVRTLHAGFEPNRVLALHDPKTPVPEAIPLLQGRPAAGNVTLYVCENFTCQAPIVGVEAVTAALVTESGKIRSDFR